MKNNETARELILDASNARRINEGKRYHLLKRLEEAERDTEPDRSIAIDSIIGEVRDLLNNTETFKDLINKQYETRRSNYGTCIRGLEQPGRQRVGDREKKGRRG